MKYKILISALAACMLIGCEKEVTPMMDFYESDVNEGLNTEEYPEGPYIWINSVTPVDYCDHVNATYGVEFEVDGATFSNFYQNSLFGGVNIIVKKGSITGQTVMTRFDRYCPGETALRTTISDFNCSAIGPMATLAKNETYYIKAYYGNHSSSWHQFTTPNTDPCAW